MKKLYGWTVVDDCYSDLGNLTWADERFGPSNSAGRWFWDNGKFYFRNEEDALLYILKWNEHKLQTLSE